MRMRSAIVAAAISALAVTGGAGLALASTPTAAPAAPAATSQQADTPEPGDTPDVAGQADQHGQ